MMRALLKARSIGEPDGKTKKGPDHRPEDAHDKSVRPHDKRDVLTGGADRCQHAERALPPLGEHGEATDRHRAR